MDQGGAHRCFLMTMSCMIVNLIGRAQSDSWLIYGYTSKQVAGNASNTRSSGIIIRPITSNTTNYSIPLPPMDPVPNSVSHDFEKRKVYWSDDGSISMAGFDGGKIEKLDGLNVSQIAVDWITKNIYYVGLNHDELGFCEAVRGEHAILTKNSSYQIRDIALNPVVGAIYWTDWGNALGIHKIGMDGSDLVKINGQTGPRPRSVTIDYKASRLYWVDDEGISMSDLKGQGAFRLTGPPAITAKGWAVTSEQVFWMDGNEVKYCIVKELCNTHNTLVALEPNETFSFKSLAVAHARGQPRTRKDPCRNSSCSRLCVLSGLKGHKCMCPAKLEFLKINSSSQEPNPKLIFTSLDGIQVYDLGTCETTHFPPTPGSAPAIAIDVEHHKIYWGWRFEGWPAIYTSNLDGSNPEMVVKVVVNRTVTGLAYDWIGENVYYTDGKQIGMCALRLKNCTIVMPSMKDPIEKIGTDPNVGLLFVKTKKEIGRASMDGIPQQFLDIDLHPGIAVDARDSKIILATINRKVWWSAYDATAVIEFHGFNDPVQSMAVMGDIIYWTEGWSIRTFNKMSPPRQTIISTEIIDFRGGTSPVSDMFPFHSSDQPRRRINHCAAGRCSDFCVPTANYFKCLGPERIKMSPKGHICDGRGFQGKAHVFKCGNNYTCSDGTCLNYTHVCDGKFDCDDCSDEGPSCETSCSTMKCSAGCHNSPRGPRCVCPKGYKVGGDKVTCEDVDECKLEPPVCPNSCLNTEGSFKCHDSSDRGKIMVAATVPTIVVVFVVAIAVFFGRKYLQARKVLRNLTPEEIQEFLEGNENVAVELEAGMEQAMLLPFRMILAPDDVIVAREAVLGSGNFGIVYRGFYKSHAVAIKTFKRTVEIDEFKAVLAETKIMAYIGQHDHVIKLIGADVSQISDRKLGLVTELSPYGDLLGYLRKIEPLFRQQGCTPDGVTQNTLQSWCSQIASGMEHLELKKIVHGDLATRNVLVFNDNVVKITDFGLSKQLYASSEYVIKHPRPLPWRWCALELLSRREFSTDSDIWAYGVTAWEILSLGRIPYEHHRSLSPEFIQYLEQGNRLCKPEYATQGIYAILLDCWSVDRATRPTFTTLKDFFAVEDSKSVAVTSSDVKAVPTVDCQYYVCDGKATIAVEGLEGQSTSNPVYQNVM